VKNTKTLDHDAFLTAFLIDRKILGVLLLNVPPTTKILAIFLLPLAHLYQAHFSDGDTNCLKQSQNINKSELLTANQSLPFTRKLMSSKKEVSDFY